MAKKRRDYTDEFKRDAVRLVTEQGYGVTEACRSLGISTSMLHRWRLQFDPPQSMETSSPALSSSEREELDRLRREVKRLRMEREILKNGFVGSGTPFVMAATPVSRLSSPSWEERPSVYWRR